MSDLARFPWPFREDRHEYTVNVEPARVPRDTEAGSWGATILDVDEDYRRVVAERARLLDADPRRCQVLPHMAPAAWDAVELLCTELAAARPGAFALTRDGDVCRWVNRPLGLEQDFVLGDPATLPCEPFAWITRQVQEDVELLDQRQGTLWLDAGILTFGADWSLDFDLGMSFAELHRPVPGLREAGVVDRALAFLLRLPAGEPYRRTNWSMTVGRRLHTNAESRPAWVPQRAALTADRIGQDLHLRVEVQHFVRLPRSNAVMFPIRTHLLALDDVCRVPAWARRLQRVLATLPTDVVVYKGLAGHRDRTVAWLAERTGEAVAA